MELGADWKVKNADGKNLKDILYSKLNITSNILMKDQLTGDDDMDIYRKLWNYQKMLAFLREYERKQSL